MAGERWCGAFQIHGLSGDELPRASRLTAKIDNSCLQNGIRLYGAGEYAAPVSFAQEFCAADLFEL